MARGCQLSTREGGPERPLQGWRVEEKRIWEVLSFRNCVLHHRRELGSFVVGVVVFEIISRDWDARQAETFFLGGDRKAEKSISGPTARKCSDCSLDYF
jgi:hypothetical protein